MERDRKKSPLVQAQRGIVGEKRAQTQANFGQQGLVLIQIFATAFV